MERQASSNKRKIEDMRTEGCAMLEDATRCGIFGVQVECANPIASPRGSKKHIILIDTVCGYLD